MAAVSTCETLIRAVLIAVWVSSWWREKGKWGMLQHVYFFPLNPRRFISRCPFVFDFFLLFRVWAHAAREVITLSITHSYDIPCFNRGPPNRTHHIKRFNSRNQGNSSLNQALTGLFVDHGNGFGTDDPSQPCFRCSCLMVNSSWMRQVQACSLWLSMPGILGNVGKLRLKQPVGKIN